MTPGSYIRDIDEYSKKFVASMLIYKTLKILKSRVLTYSLVHTILNGYHYLATYLYTTARIMLMCIIVQLLFYKELLNSYYYSVIWFIIVIFLSW